MSNPTNVKCSVLFKREDLKNLLSTIQGKDRPKGLVFKVGGVDNSKLTIDEKTKINVARIFAIPVWFDGEKMVSEQLEQGNIITAEKIVKVNGEDYSPYDQPVWESADIFMEEDFHFNFSFFYYDALDLILNIAGSHIQGRAYDKLMLGTIKSNFGDDSNDTISVAHGNSFAFKLEPFLDRNAIPKENLIPPISIGVPLFAIGLPCRKNWEKAPEAWMKRHLEDSNSSLIEIVESFQAPE